MNKILVIGSNSFSGSNFINYLLNKNNQVYGISRSNEINKVFLSYKKNMNIKNFKYYKIDINKNHDKIIKLIKNHKIKYIINFASQGMVNESWKNPLDWYYTNFISQVKLAEKLNKINYIEKYLHVSTPEVYGNNNFYLKEENLFNPSTPYAVSRAACEFHLKNLYKSYNFPVAFTRSANVFGPTQQLYRIIPRTILYFLLNKKLELHGGGKSRRSFILIDDVCEITYKILLSKKSTGQSYNISTDKAHSIKKIVQIISKKMSINFQENVINTEDRLGKDDNYLLSSIKLKKQFNWEPKHSLFFGIDKTINWVNENLDILKKQNFNYIHKK